MSKLKLTELTLAGFRKFQKEDTLALVSPAGNPLDYVVLAGPNGCGKTTILEAIALVLGRDELLSRDLAPREVAAATRIGVPPGATLTATLLDARLDPPLSVRVTRTATKHEVDFPGQSGLDGRRFDWQEYAPPVEYISSRRRAALLGPIQESVQGRLPDDTEADRILLLKNRILQQQGRRGNPGYRGPAPLDQTWLARLNAFWAAFRHDGTTFALDVVDASVIDETWWNLYLFNGPTRVCPVDALSSGELEILGMAAPFIVRGFDGLLLFDEPELHLHPEWQARVVRAMRALLPEAQIIVTSHADDPWDDAMSWERFLLVPDDDPRSAVWRAQHADPGDEE